jgi:hypothetical protein
MSLDERCSYPEVHVATKQGEAEWNMSFRIGYVVRLRYTPTMGITFESPTVKVRRINFGRNEVRLQIPDELDIKVNRTESLQTLITPIHPYLGFLRALLEKTLCFNLILKSIIMKLMLSRGKNHASEKKKKARESRSLVPSR